MSDKVIFSDEKILDIYEESDTTILDILPAGIQQAYSLVPKDIREMEDDDLLRLMRENITGRKPTDKRKDIRIKHSLWHEYDRAMEEGRKMRLNNIIHGIMAHPNFKSYLENKPRLEWVMRPPHNYWNEQRVLLEKSTMGLHEILDIPVVRRVCRCHWHCLCARKGNRSFATAEDERDTVCLCKDKCICPPTFDVKMAGIKQKLHEMIELRVKGAILQRVRVDKQHLIAQIRADKSSTEELNTETAKALPTTSVGIEEELKKLRGELKRLKSGTRQDVFDMTKINEPDESKSTT